MPDALELDEQAGLRLLALLAAGGPPGDVFGAVVAEASALLGGPATTLLRYEEGGAEVTVLATRGGPGQIGARFPIRRDPIASRIKRSAGVDQLDAGGGFAAGAPITIDGRAWGVLTAHWTNEPPPEDAQARLSRLAEIVAAAVSSAHARDALRQLVDEQSALRRVAELVAGGGAETELFDTVAVEAARLIGDEGTTLVRFDGPRTFTVVATCGGPAPVGLRVEVAEDDTGTAAEVIRTRRAARRDDYQISAGPLFDRADYGKGSSVSVPILVEDRLWGLLGTLTEHRRLPEGTEERLQKFAELVAAALANSQARAEVQRLADEQAALRRVAELGAHGAGEVELCQAVTVEAAGLVGNEATTLVRYEGSRTFTVVATHGGPVPPGTSLVVPPEDRGAFDQMLRQPDRPVRLDAYAAEPGPTLARDRYGVGSSVSVPIRVDSRLWGMLGVLTEGRPLPTETEARLQKFAELVAAALANSQARAQVQRLADEQAALRRVAELIARGALATEVFATAAEELGKLTAVEGAKMLRYEPEQMCTFVASWGPLQAGIPVGRRLSYKGNSVTARIFETWRPARVEDYVNADGSLAALLRREGMQSAAGAPIIVDGHLWGALLVGSVQPDPLPPDTEQRIAEFAELVAAAISNLEARAEVERLAETQSALRRVAELVARSAPLDEVFRAIATESSRLLGSLATTLTRFDLDGSGTVVAACNSSVPLNLHLPPDGDTVAGRVFRSGRPARLATFAGTTMADLAAQFDVGAAVGVPITVDGRIWATLATTTSGSELPLGTEERLEEFAALAAAAIANAENKAALSASRARVLATADETRRRLQRDVHDGAQQRLVQTVMTLNMARDALARGASPAGLVDEALYHAQRATSELRDLVHGILPGSLSRGGLRAGLESLIADLSEPVHLECTAPRLPAPTETTAYFIVAEALTNVAKHANASRTEVRVGVKNDKLSIEITDNGDGGADPALGTGLTGLSDRVQAAEGTLLITSRPGAGTMLRAELPIISKAPTDATSALIRP